MNEKMKYIIVELDGEIPIPFIFPEIIPHDEFYMLVRQKISNYKPKVVGAGFVYLVLNNITCYGTSISLGIDSRFGIDEDIIRKNLGKENE